MFNFDDQLNIHQVVENGFYYRMYKGRVVKKNNKFTRYLKCCNHENGCKVTGKIVKQYGEIDKSFKEEKHLSYCDLFLEEDLPPSNAQKNYIIDLARILATESSDFASPHIIYKKLIKVSE